MSRYVYSGPDTNLGRFNSVKTGDILDLNAEEEASIQGNENFFPVPTRVRNEKKVTSNTTLSSDDVGKKIVCKHSAATKITLPENPSKGDRFEIYFSESADATKDITIEPGTVNAIDGPDSDKQVTGVAVTEAGSYSAIPTISFSGGDGSGTTATARMKALTGTPSAAGSGYAPGDTITLAAGTKTEAAVLTVGTVKLVSAVVPNFESSGTGYVIDEVITLAGGTNTVAAKVKVASCQARTCTPVAAGTGYAANDLLNVTGGTKSTTAVIKVLTVGGSGEILTAEIQTRGEYTVLPANAVATTKQAGGGNNAATFNISWGIVTVTVDTAGNYSVLPSNPVAQASSTGSGTGATFTSLWGVLTVSVTTAGNYSALTPSPATQGSTSGSGTGSTNVIAWGVLSVTVSAGGDGYTEEPTVVFSSGTAAATASIGVIPGNLVLDAATDSVGVYWNGAIWKTY